MWKWIVVAFLVICFFLWCSLKVGSDYDDQMEELMKEGK